MLVPLALLKKGGPVRALDTAGPNGEVLPVLTGAQNGTVALMTLAAAWELFVGDVDAEVLGILQRLAHAPTIEAGLAAYGDLATRWGADPPVFLTDLAYDLALNFLLIVVLPRAGAGERQVLKYSTDHGHRIEQGGWRGSVQRLLTSWGFRSYPFPVEIGDPSWAQSYHLEIRLPAPLRAVRMQMPTVAGGAPPRTVWGHGRMVHAAASYDDPVETAVAQLRVGVGHESIRLVAALVAWFTAAVFLLAEHLPNGRLALWQASDGSVAILLSAPAIAIALLAGVGENRLATHLLLPLRVVTVSAAVTLTLAAASLVGKLEWQYLDRLWTAGWVCWTLLAVVMSAGLLFTGYRVRRAEAVGEPI